MFVLELYEHLSTLELNNQYTNEWRKQSLLSEVDYHRRIEKSCTDVRIDYVC